MHLHVALHADVTAEPAAPQISAGEKGSRPHAFGGGAFFPILKREPHGPALIRGSGLFVFGPSFTLQRVGLGSGALVRRAERACAGWAYLGGNGHARLGSGCF